LNRYVALLRAINLGARRRVPMAGLREVLTEHGHQHVRTHLQSGNVVLSSDLEPERLGRDLAQQIATAFGFDVPVIVRTRDELAEVIERDPLGHVAEDPARYLVTFLPAPAQVDLSDVDVSPEQMVMIGREVYSWHPDGLQRSRAAQVAERTFGRSGTARNWNTVCKLLELADAP
jgi:uncharacterized protein (DUF1697 family)